MSEDEFVAFMLRHQQVGTLVEACSCGVGSMGLVERGQATVLHWRHLSRALDREVLNREEV